MDWAQALLLVTVIFAFAYGAYSIHEQDKKYDKKF